MRLGMLRLLAALCVSFGSLAIVSGSVQAADAVDLVLRGDKVCTKCHDEGESYPVLSIGRTKHGTMADSRTPTCTSCHGESVSHINKPEGQSIRPKPDRYFTKNAAVPIEERNGACMNCHEGGSRMFWSGSTHHTKDVACSSCHQVHTQNDQVRDKKTQSEVCFECHKQQRTQVNKPWRHPIPEGKVACSDCHNPHGTNGEKLLARETVNDTCYQCHAEKRGPFLWYHQPVVENCGYCHNPHGTTVAGLLKWRAPFLCDQCHESNSHRGSIPGISFGSESNAAGLGVTAGRSCMNCHMNIHGGNSPVDAAQARSLRR